jgi:hypothetical protein
MISVRSHQGVSHHDRWVDESIKYDVAGFTYSQKNRIENDKQKMKLNITLLVSALLAKEAHSHLVRDSPTKAAIEAYYHASEKERITPWESVPIQIIKNHHNIKQDEDFFVVKRPIDYNFNRQRGVARLSDSYAAKLKVDLGIVFDPSPDSNRLLQIIEFKETSEPHIDAYPSDHSNNKNQPRRIVDDTLVAFVMLNDNPDAYFNHGETSVPISKGTIIKFPGTIPHNTIVNSGSVKLLGPFDVDTFQGVGLAAAVAADDVEVRIVDSDGTPIVCTCCAVNNGMWTGTEEYYDDVQVEITDSDGVDRTCVCEVDDGGGDGSTGEEAMDEDEEPIDEKEPAPLILPKKKGRNNGGRRNLKLRG